MSPQIITNCALSISNRPTGINGTIFAYGQTSSGKTHTMMGHKGEAGVIPLAVNEIFDCIEKASNKEFMLSVSCMEIYNETITDLLGGSNTRALTCLLVAHVHTFSIASLACYMRKHSSPLTTLK